MRVLRIFISPGHNFVGHFGAPPGEHPLLEVNRVECVAGLGLRGDRYFGHRPDYKGQITFFAAEVLAGMERELGLKALHPGMLRRNVLVSGIDLNTLIGSEFVIDGVRFAGTEEARPCSWMNLAVQPGAEDWLRGRGGLRARILSDGWLRVRERIN